MIVTNVTKCEKTADPISRPSPIVTQTAPIGFHNYVVLFIKIYVAKKPAVSDETKNLNETETETFFRYQNFSIPNPILFSIPKFSETDTDTFFDTKNFRNRYRYFFRNLFFPKPIPILITIPFFSIPIIIIILSISWGSAAGWVTRRADG